MFFFVNNCKNKYKQKNHSPKQKQPQKLNFLAGLLFPYPEIYLFLFKFILYSDLMEEIVSLV